MILRAAFVVLFVWACLLGHSQNYHAIHGSSNAASLNVSNNPASIVNAPNSWDLTLFAFQAKTATNAITVYNYSLLSSPANSQYAWDEGNFARKADFNFNINLLNARIALNRKSAIAFGANIRGYTHLRTGKYNFIDSLPTLNDFALINDPALILHGKGVSSSWIELFATFSRTLWDNDQTRLNGGATLKVSRGISGGHAKADNIGMTRSFQPPVVAHFLRSASLTYGYSSNYDSWQSDRSTSQNINDFVKRTEGGISIDLGAELLIKTQAVNTFSDEDDGYYEYEWKIGASLLDLGTTNFKYGNKSRHASNPRPNLSADDLQQKFETVADFQGFADSLATVVSNYYSLRGTYAIMNPMRLVLNVDRYLLNNVYLNGEVSLNLSPLAGNKKFYTQEMNLVTVTPRWETRRWGAYLPLQFNNAGKFWVGGAFKAGPILFGIHNFATVFSKTKMQNGGGYLALVVRSRTKTEARRYKKVDCFR